MFKNYFKVAYRQLFKNKLFSLVNILGLSTGLASIMVLALLVFQYLTANSNQKDIDHMYYLRTEASNGNHYQQTTYPLLGEIVKSCPEVEAATHIQQIVAPWYKYGQKEFQETPDFVDTGYFKVFQFPFKYGNPATALVDKFSIVLSEETAQKYFGDQDPIGRTLTSDDTLQLTVTGVLKHIPENSIIHPVVLQSTAWLEAHDDFKSMADWYNGFARGYLRLRPGADPRLLDVKINQIVQAKYNPERRSDKVFAVPFRSIREEGGNTASVLIKGAIGSGIFILLIILVNLINLNAASSYARAKEVAVRQMVGSTKKSIILQFCVENALLIGISTVLAWLLFSNLLLPQMNTILKERFGEVALSLSRQYPLLVFFIALGLLLAVLAGSLPGWKLVALKVTDTVKGKLGSGNYKTSLLRNVFITVQFILAITLICITVILNRQISYMKSATPGFNKDEVAIARLDLAFRDQKTAEIRFRSILNDLKQNPHVRSVSTNGVIPTAYWENFNEYSDPQTHRSVNIRHVGADAGLQPTFEIPMVQGRNFDDALVATEKHSIMINRSAMKAFGWTNAIGKQIVSKGGNETCTIVGVMEDFHYRDLEGSIEPMLHWYTGKPSLENNSYLSVRTDPGYMRSVMQQLEQAFKTIPSRRSFSYNLMSERVDKQYALLDGILKVTNFIALLTILIASMGMFGLISLFARQRVKEIGIRKVLGSDVAGIVKLLSRDFVLLVAIAIAFAVPLAWYVMAGWLHNFAYHISIRWWMFAVAGLIALLITCVTVGLQATRAALANPVKSLRSE